MSVYVCVLVSVVHLIVKLRFEWNVYFFKKLTEATENVTSILNVAV